MDREPGTGLGSQERGMGNAEKLLLVLLAFAAIVFGLWWWLG
jgi:hypothetical protein